MHSLHIKSSQSVSVYTPQSRPLPCPAHHPTNSSSTRADILLNTNDISLPLVPSPNCSSVRAPKTQTPTHSPPRKSPIGTASQIRPSPAALSLLALREQCVTWGPGVGGGGALVSVRSSAGPNHGHYLYLYRTLQTSVLQPLTRGPQVQRDWKPHVCCFGCDLRCVDSYAGPLPACRGHTWQDAAFRVETFPDPFDRDGNPRLGEFLRATRSAKFCS